MDTVHQGWKVVGQGRLYCELFAERAPCELPYYGASTIFSCVRTVRQFRMVVALCNFARR